MIIWWMNLAGSTAGFMLGSVLLKRFADTSHAPSLLLSFSVLAASNILFVQVIRSGLGQAVIASSMTQIIVMAALGVLIFGERMSVFQVFGVALAATSIFMVMWSAPSAAG